jgi:hypothetical protein
LASSDALAVPTTSPAPSGMIGNLYLSASVGSPIPATAHMAVPEHCKWQEGFGHCFGLLHFQLHEGLLQWLWHDSLHCVVQIGVLQMVRQTPHLPPEHSELGQITAHRGGPHRVSHFASAFLHSVLHWGGTQTGSQTWSHAAESHFHSQAGLHSLDPAGAETFSTARGPFAISAASSEKKSAGNLSEYAVLPSSSTNSPRGEKAGKSDLLASLLCCKNSAGSAVA